MKKKLLIGLATGLFLCGIVGAAAASLIEVDFISANDGGITLDGATGLEWLDLGLTANMSYNQVIAASSGDGYLAGFRYATEYEIGSFFEHALLNYMTGFRYEGPVADLKTIWGGSLAQYDYIAFIIDHKIAYDIRYKGRIKTGNTTPNADIRSGFINDWDSRPLTGSALVRTSSPVPAPVPEPATMLLFGTGLAGLAGVGRRRKNK